MNSFARLWQMNSAATELRPNCVPKVPQPSRAIVVSLVVLPLEIGNWNAYEVCVVRFLCQHFKCIFIEIHIAKSQAVRLRIDFKFPKLLPTLSTEGTPKGSHVL